MRAADPAPDRSANGIGSMERSDLEGRIRHYESQCACGVAMITGLGFALVLLCAFLLGWLVVPGSGWRTAASFAAAIVGGNVLGKLAGALYFSLMADRLKRRIPAWERSRQRDELEVAAGRHP